MEITDINNLRQTEGITEAILPLKEKLEGKLNLIQTQDYAKRVSLNNNKVMRICLLAGLSLSTPRTQEEIEKMVLSKNNARIFYATFFTNGGLKDYIIALLKFRYNDANFDWYKSPTLSKVIGYEISKGLEYLLEDEHLNSFLFSTTTNRATSHGLPTLDLVIGDYGEDDMEATLNLSGREITNTQIIIAGATGSGKTNLLAVLLEQMRGRSIETAYPVNFLLFDYKGEFSDPENEHWLSHFETDRGCILDPIEKPLPFTPFKDFTGKTINELNLYSTEMAQALCAIDKATISANMSNRLSEAIVDAYNETNFTPITFKLILEKYQAKLSDPEKDDSITSVLKQLVRTNIFAERDLVNLTEQCFIVRMDKFPKDGPIAKAIVYFIISKLNNIYEQLPKQEVDENNVQIRHFTIIDEAHYMLGFDNRPLRNLIAVGRNKGLSIILATQNMADFKSKHFDFYANAQYPLIMKQQAIDDGVIRDLYGVSGKELAEIRSVISGLTRGELIIKNQDFYTLNIGKRYKKIKVSHLI